MMSIMLAITVPITIYVFKKSKFRWVKMMFTLCVLQNVFTLYLGFGDFYEQSKHSETNTIAMSFIVSSACFFFFMTTILLYWLFGFKYWVISIEVPRFLKGETE